MIRFAPSFAAVALSLTTSAIAGRFSDPPTARTTTMTKAQATGMFDVTVTPVAGGDASIGVLTIAKTFHGDLDGTSIGQMLAVRTPVEGSAGYVAMERVTATLAGRKGSFALQHSGTMANGTQSLSVGVVPDSGTDGLVGLTGSMTIRIEGGKHVYDFAYALPKRGPKQGA